MSVRDLYAFEIFQGLDKHQLESLAKNLKLVTYPAGTIIFMPSDTYYDRFCILMRGRVELYRLNRNGQRLDVGQLAPGDIFGINGIFSKHGQNNYAEATEDSAVYVASREYLLNHIKQYPDFLMCCLKSAANTISHLEERLIEMSYNRAETNLKNFLLLNADPDTGELYNLTHEQIGNIIGTSRQTVTESLGNMQKQGILSIKRKSIKIIDRTKLRESTY